jgi:hypothetical protein
MFRIITAVGALLAAGAVLSAVSPAASEKDPFPEVIPAADGLPARRDRGRQGNHVLCGLRRERGDLRGDLRTGTGAILVPGAAGKAATGIELDSHNRLFVAGAATGTATVYNAGTGALIRNLHARHGADVHQRRRGHAHGRVLHRFAEAGALPRTYRADRCASETRRRST